MSTFSTKIVVGNPRDFYLNGFGSAPDGEGPNLVDRYFRDFSWRLHQFGFVTTYSVTEAETGTVIGLFALSCGSALLRGGAAAPLLKDTALRYEFVYNDGESEFAVVPTVHINYLALGRSFQGKYFKDSGEKYSTILMLRAFRTAAAFSRELGVMFLELDALDERAFRAYHRIGFRSDAGGIEDLSRIVFDPENDNLPKMLLPISRLR